MPGPHGFAVRYNIARLAHLDRSRGSSRPAISSVRHAAASTASHPNVRDDGQRPSSGQDGGTSSFDLPDGESELFFVEGTGQDFADLPVAQNFRAMPTSRWSVCRRYPRFAAE